MSARRQDRDAVLSDFLDAIAVLGLFALFALLWLGVLVVVGFLVVLSQLAGLL